ncbi:MAG TPA: XRE family transcriptional regulator [Stellaceae bacterium]
MFGRFEQSLITALKEIEHYFENEPELGSPEADRFDILAALIGAYEQEHWPIEPPDAVTAIREVMALRNYTQSDLANLLGSRSRASELLSRRRPLTMDQAKKLHRGWLIPAESLLAG